MDADDIAAAEGAFIDGFRQVSDKLGFLRLARIPLELAYGGGPSLKLMQVAIEEVTEVGRASPGFSSRELVYHPLPQGLSTTRLSLAFHYVSLKTRRILSFAALLERPVAAPAGGRAAPDIFDGH
jgi:hypothetical protein